VIQRHRPRGSNRPRSVSFTRVPDRCNPRDGATAYEESAPSPTRFVVGGWDGVAFIPGLVGVTLASEGWSSPTAAKEHARIRYDQPWVWD
jgi:hypothetical protein